MLCSLRLEFVPFVTAYIDHFLCIAKAEGWLSTKREMEFLLNSYPQGCYAVLDSGQPVAFITSIRYARSAWIGNLLVLTAYRKAGIGRALMQKTLNHLDHSGCRTVWLTASADGAHLYRTLGFNQVDRVQRWQGSIGFSGEDAMPLPSKVPAAIDLMGWGDKRRLLCQPLYISSVFICRRDAFMVYSVFDDFQHIGPWGAASPAAAADLFHAAAAGRRKSATFLDVPEKNSFAGELLLSEGFSVAGSCLLMFRGRAPQYAAEYVYSLASLGSYG